LLVIAKVHGKRQSFIADPNATAKFKGLIKFTSITRTESKDSFVLVGNDGSDKARPLELEITTPMDGPVWFKAFEEGVEYNNNRKSGVPKAPSTPDL